jgi:hypothetical protein
MINTKQSTARSEESLSHDREERVLGTESAGRIDIDSSSNGFKTKFPKEKKLM